MIPTLEQIAGRLPEKLIRTFLYLDGNYCTVGFILHELGVGVQAMDGCRGAVFWEDVPEELRDPEDYIGVNVIEILRRAYPDIQRPVFAELMRLNDANCDDGLRAEMSHEALRQLSQNGTIDPWVEHPKGEVRWK